MVKKDVAPNKDYLFSQLPKAPSPPFSTYCFPRVQVLLFSVSWLEYRKLHLPCVQCLNEFLRNLTDAKAVEFADAVLDILALSW